MVHFRVESSALGVERSCLPLSAGHCARAVINCDAAIEAHGTPCYNCDMKVSDVLRTYLVIAEKTETGCSAYSPDLPGCVATGKTRVELEKTMKDAILFHLDGLREDRETIPVPHAYCMTCEVSA